MKKFKILIIVLLTYLLTGCTANYTLTISGNSIEEKTTIYMNNDEYTKFSSNNDNQYINMYIDDEYNTAEEGTQLPLPKVTYYDFKKNDTLNTATYTGNFKFGDYKRSSIHTLGFKTAKIQKTDNKISINTSTGFTFPYDEITEVTINIVSSYNVSYSNADLVSGDTLTWKINRTNAKNKYISVSYQTNTSTTTDNNINKEAKKTNIKLILMIGASVILIGFTIFLILLHKYRKTNNV